MSGKLEIGNCSLQTWLTSKREKLEHYYTHEISERTFCGIINYVLLDLNVTENEGLTFSKQWEQAMANVQTTIFFRSTIISVLSRDNN